MQGTAICHAGWEGTEGFELRKREVSQAGGGRGKDERGESLRYGDGAAGGWPGAVTTIVLWVCEGSHFPGMVLLAASLADYAWLTKLRCCSEGFFQGRYGEGENGVSLCMPYERKLTHNGWNSYGGEYEMGCVQVMVLV